jgi:hypothetical protein
MLDGTEEGTFDHATTANPFVDKITTYVDGNHETTLNGKTTGEENPVDGIVTDSGIETYEIAEFGIV